MYYFDPKIVQNLISTSVRQALEQLLNYARNYLADLLEPCVRRVIYLDSEKIKTFRSLVFSNSRSPELDDLEKLVAEEVVKSK